MSQLQENVRKERQKDEQTLIHRTILATGPIMGNLPYETLDGVFYIAFDQMSTEIKIVRYETIFFTTKLQWIALFFFLPLISLPNYIFL